MHEPTHHLIFETPAGFCGIAWNGGAVVRLQLPTQSHVAAERNLLRRLPESTAGLPSPEIVGVVPAIKRYFAGERIDFSGTLVDLSGQGGFYRRIYEEVRRIRWGQTTTYGTIAKELGAGPEGAREVGQAMATNPIPLIIPCHRVLAAGGKLGGFSAPGGSAAKMRMLTLEGFPVVPPGSPQQSLF